MVFQTFQLEPKQEIDVLHCDVRYLLFVYIDNEHTFYTIIPLLHAMCSIYHSILLMRKNTGDNPLNLFHSLQGLEDSLDQGFPNLLNLPLPPPLVSQSFFS